MMLKKLILSKYPDFFKELDENLKLFAKEIKKELRDERDGVIAITAYPGEGKSNFAAILGLLIDDNYKFENICFIPTSKEIKERYMNLPMYSILHVDESSRGLHKQRWYDKVQQTLNTLYDCERENHYLCTLLLMPRFQNFAENFRNFRIRYWIHIPKRGLAIFYRRDEDKDAKDPWHIDDNYKNKNKVWKRKRIFDRSLSDVVRIEQITENYWFYCQIPAIPEDIWAMYKKLKIDSRIVQKDENLDVENYRDKIEREKLDRWNKISQMSKEGLTAIEQAVKLNCSEPTIRRAWREMRVYDKFNNTHYFDEADMEVKNKDIKNKSIPEEFNKL